MDLERDIMYLELTILHGMKESLASMEKILITKEAAGEDYPIHVYTPYFIKIMYHMLEYCPFLYSGDIWIDNCHRNSHR